MEIPKNRQIGCIYREGQSPYELERIDVYGFRQVNCMTYRIIYAVETKTVLIYAVIDGRRDVQAALMKRLCRV